MFRVRGDRAGAAARSVTYTVTQNLDDGTSEASGPLLAAENVVLVPDLLEGALDLVFVPQFDAAAVASVFVDIEYADPANNYTRTLREEVTAAQTEPLRVHLALRDATVRNYRFRLTFSGPGLFDQRAFVDTTETLIPLR